MNVFDGTQSHSTAAPPMPSESIDGDLARRGRGRRHQCRLVAGRAATDDHDAGRHSPNLAGDDAQPQRVVRSRSRTIRSANVGSPRARSRLSFPRAALRRLRVEHASRADAAACTPLADGRNRLVARLAADVRRRGHRLGRRAGHRRRGSATRKVFVVLYDMTPADEKNLDRWEGSELGIHKKIRCRVERLSSDTTTDPVLAWLYVRRRLGGRSAVGALPRRDGRRRRNRGRARRIRARPAHPRRPQHRPGNYRLIKA